MKLWIVFLFGFGGAGFVSWDSGSVVWLRVPGAYVTWDGRPDPAAAVYTRGDDVFVQRGDGEAYVVLGAERSIGSPVADLPWVTPLFAVSRDPRVEIVGLASSGQRGRYRDIGVSQRSVRFTDRGHRVAVGW